MQWVRWAGNFGRLQIRSRASRRGRLRPVGGFAASPQKLIQHRTQGHRADRLVKKVEALLAGFMQALRGDVTRDEKRRNRSVECAAQPLYRLNAGMPASQTVVGNDQIGPTAFVGGPSAFGLR